MNIVKILMEREDINREDANEMLWDARSEVLEALENGEDAEAIFTDITGLEPEYMSCILQGQASRDKKGGIFPAFFSAKINLN